MQRYVKTICAVLGGVSTWGITAAADNSITGVELFGLLGVFSTCLAVYAFPNSPPEGEGAGPNVSERDRPLRARRQRGGVSIAGLIVVLLVVLLVGRLVGFW